MSPTLFFFNETKSYEVVKAIIIIIMIIIS